LIGVRQQYPGGFPYIRCLHAFANPQAVGLLPQGRRPRLAAALPSWFIFQPRQALLHKPLYPLIGMATADAYRRGNIGNGDAVSQEEDNPGTSDQPGTDGWRTLPR
jgi:hypothetical protein